MNGIYLYFVNKHLSSWALLGLQGTVYRLEYRIFYRVISDIFVVLRETTLTISDSIETGSPVETEMVRVVFRSTKEITEITRFEKKNDL